MRCRRSRLNGVELRGAHPQARRAAARRPAARPYRRLRDTIRSLGEEPRPRGSKKLVARDGWRLRVGDYRVAYEVDDRAPSVTVLDIGHRRDVYR